MHIMSINECGSWIICNVHDFLRSFYYCFLVVAHATLYIHITWIMKCMCNVYVWLGIFLYFLVASYHSFDLIILSVYTNWFFIHIFLHGFEWITHFIIQIQRITSSIWIIVIDWRQVFGVLRTHLYVVLAVIRWRFRELKKYSHKLEFLVLPKCRKSTEHSRIWRSIFFVIWLRYMVGGFSNFTCLF